jgi:hypothetical protein
MQTELNTLRTVTSAHNNTHDNNTSTDTDKIGSVQSTIMKT